MKIKITQTFKIQIIALVFSSCLKFSHESEISSNLNINPPIDVSKPTPSNTEGKFSDIKFSNSSNLNLISDISIRFNQSSSWPINSLLIIQDEDSNTLFYGKIQDKKDILSLQVPFNQKSLTAQIVSLENKKLIVKKIVKIKNGIIKI